jgi:hypothetical protein
MVRISYSSSTTMLGCQFKFWLDKVEKAPRDPDTVESDAFTFGKVHHKVLEDCHHDRADYTEDLLVNAARELGLDSGVLPMVYACIHSYFPVREKSGLTCVASEVEVGDGQTFTGYVDAILCDKNYNWWICDLKTSGMFSSSIFARLDQDPQLNIYAAHVNQICEKTGMDPALFAGCRYNVSVKPRMVVKPMETLQSYAARAKPANWEYAVPAVRLDPQYALNQLFRLRDMAGTLTYENAFRNRGNCMTYNKPCEFWSRCHGGLTYSQCMEKAEDFADNADTMKDCTIEPCDGL